MRSKMQRFAPQLFLEVQVTSTSWPSQSVQHSCRQAKRVEKSPRAHGGFETSWAKLITTSSKELYSLSFLGTQKKMCVCENIYIYIYYPKVQKRYRVSIVDFGAIRSFPPHGFESTHLNLQPRSFQPTSTSYDVRSLQHSSDQHFQSFRPPGHHVGIRQFLLKDRVWPIFGGGDHKVVTFQEFWKAKRTRHRAQPENPKRKKTKTSK